MIKLLPITVLFWWLFQTFPGCPRHGQRLIHSLKSASAATTSFLESLPWKSKMTRKQNYFSRVILDWNCTLVPCNTSTRNLFQNACSCCWSSIQYQNLYNKTYVSHTHTHMAVPLLPIPCKQATNPLVRSHGWTWMMIRQVESNKSTAKGQFLNLKSKFHQNLSELYRIVSFISHSYSPYMLFCPYVWCPIKHASTTVDKPQLQTRP